MKTPRLSLLDICSLAWTGLRVRRMRAALSALGIAIGIATMVVVMGIPASSQQALNRDLARLGTNLLQASATPDQQPPVAFTENATAMATRIAPVTAAAAVANTHTPIARNDRTDKAAATTVLATEPGILTLLDGTLHTGRWLDPPTPTLPPTDASPTAAPNAGRSSPAGPGAGRSSAAVSGGGRSSVAVPGGGRSSVAVPGGGRSSPAVPGASRSPTAVPDAGGSSAAGPGVSRSSAAGAFPTVVLGAEAAGRLGITDPAGGPQLMIGGHWFTVIGILNPIPLAPEIDRAALVGWPAARRHLRFDGRPTVVYVRSHEPAVEAVREVLPATVLPSAPGMVRVTRPSDALAAKRTTETTFSALFLGLAAVALLVGGIGVANTMVISVLERRREIGLRRALGAHRGQIRTQFLAESVALSILGGLTGTALGTAATITYALHQHWPPTIPPTALLSGTAGALLVGITAGVYPSIRAAHLTPTEALATT